MATNIGMMDSASLLDKLSKVEEACFGAVLFQLMDVVHPGMVPCTKSTLMPGTSVSGYMFSANKVGGSFQKNVFDLSTFVGDLTFDEDASGDDISLEGLEKELEECKNYDGCDIEKDAIVLQSRQRIGASEIGLLATVGVTDLKVYRTPTIAVLSTGDKLVHPTIQCLNRGQVPSVSNEL